MAFGIEGVGVTGGSPDGLAVTLLGRDPGPEGSFPTGMGVRKAFAGATGGVGSPTDFTEAVAPSTVGAQDVTSSAARMGVKPIFATEQLSGQVQEEKDERRRFENENRGLGHRPDGERHEQKDRAHPGENDATNDHVAKLSPIFGLKSTFSTQQWG